MRKKVSIFIIYIAVLIFVLGINNCVYAEENTEVILDENNTVYIDDVVNAGKDKGYSKSESIENGDPHYGWKLGKFAITDFSSKRKDEDGNWILLKNVNDKVSLYFILSQDINKLDGNDKLGIPEDTNGYDNEFNIKKSNFGKGMLIVRKIDSTGNKNEPVLYRNYLNGIAVGANTKIDVFEEGDYEVALDYEVRNNGIAFLDGYSNYRIRFNFSVRNGNCMVFPFDVETSSELTNTSITENGFYLDLANSKYLNVNIKKEVLKDGADGLVEDTRYNRPAKSGEHYTEEGIYTITAKNEYTNETTIKKIYVGQNKVLKAHVQNADYSISQIKEMVAKGATIDENGNISYIPEEYKTNTKENDEKIENIIDTVNKEIKDDTKQDKKINALPILIPIILVLVFIGYKFIMNKKQKELELEKLKKIKEEEKIENAENDEKTIVEENVINSEEAKNEEKNIN